MHSSHFSPTPLQFVGSFRIPHVDRDASGLTLHRETGHLWVVIDKPERLVEFTDEGEFVSTVELTGFQDTEGLCHLGGDRFAIAEERKMRITLVEIPRGTTKIDNDGRRFDLDEKAKKNKGLEGVTYDDETDTLFTVREDKPPTLFRIHPLITEHEWQTTDGQSLSTLVNRRAVVLHHQPISPLYFMGRR